MNAEGFNQFNDEEARNNDTAPTTHQAAKVQGKPLNREAMQRSSFTFTDKKPMNSCLILSGYMFFVLSCLNTLLGLYIYFYLTKAASDHIKILVFSVKYLTSLVFAFGFVMMPAIVCKCSDLGIGLTVPSFMFACAVQQAVSTVYGVNYLVN